MQEVFDEIERAHIATLPTPLERGPELPGGARLWVKRDDLTGLGGGGNKARKLEFLCGDAQAHGAKALVTVGAAQSNHCRMTAAAGAVLGMETHLVLSGDAPASTTGNQLLSTLFGAQLHFTGAEESHWGELEIAREALTERLWSDGLRPYSMGIGGSSAVGAAGYALGIVELLHDCDQRGIRPKEIVFTSSSGGTHAGLLAGRALRAIGGAEDAKIVAIGVAKGVNMGMPDVAELANELLDRMKVKEQVDPADVHIDTRWMGDDYAVPSDAGDNAIRWAARNGGWILDRTYSGKGFSGVLGRAKEGQYGPGDDVVFIHTGGWPALFAPEGVPLMDD